MSYSKSKDVLLCFCFIFFFISGSIRVNLCASSIFDDLTTENVDSCEQQKVCLEKSMRVQELVKSRAIGRSYIFLKRNRASCLLPYIGNGEVNRLA